MIAAIGSPEGENVQNQCSRSVIMPVSSADEVTPNDNEAGDHTGQSWDRTKVRFRQAAKAR